MSPGIRLERDGTTSGWQITIVPTNAFRLSVKGMVVRSNGTVAGVTYESPENSAAGFTWKIINDDVDVILAHLTSGNFYSVGNITEVTFSRAAGDFYWVGSVISSFNQ